MLLISRGMDLSVGASLSVSGLAAGLTILATGSTTLGVFAGVATGTLIGFVNGVLCASNRANPFIITLGTMTFLQGVAIIISGGSPINGSGALFDVFGLGSTFGIPNPIYVFVLVLVVCLDLPAPGSARTFCLCLGGKRGSRAPVRRAGPPIQNRALRTQWPDGWLWRRGLDRDASLCAAQYGYRLRVARYRRRRHWRHAAERRSRIAVGYARRGAAAWACVQQHEPARGRCQLSKR